MLGRGPRCYNNSGNRMLRKLIQEYVVYYKNNTRRREKAALVTLLVSRLQARGYRFLYLSSNGIWLEALTHIAERKVGHGLRDARLSVDKHEKVLPKNFRSSLTGQKNKDQVTPVVTGEAKNKEKMPSEKSDATEVDPIGVDPQCCAAPPTKQQKCPKDVVDCSSERSVHRMQGAPETLQGTEQQLIDTNMPSFPNKLFLAASVLERSPSVQEEKKDGKFSYHKCAIQENVDYWDSGGDVKSMTEQWPSGCKSSSRSEVEQRLSHWQRSCHDVNNAMRLAYDARSSGEPLDTHNLNAVDMALRMCAPVFGRSFDNSFDDDPWQPTECAVEDAQSLCRWFNSLA